MAFLDRLKSINPFNKKEDFDLDKELQNLTQDSNQNQNSSSLGDPFAANSQSADMNQVPFDQGVNNGQMFQNQGALPQDTFSNPAAEMQQDYQNQMQPGQMQQASIDPMMNNQHQMQKQMPSQGQPLYQELPIEETPAQFPSSYPAQPEQEQRQFDPNEQFQMLKPAPLQAADHKSIRMEKEIEVIQAKLDTLKAVLDSINQRLASLEEQNRYKRNNW